MEPVLAQAQELLGVSFESVDPLVPEGRRHRVLRCRFEGGSVIVKQIVEGPLVEREALTLLQGTGRTPRVLAGDSDFVVLEDLGGERLDRKLLRAGDADAAPLLIEMAVALGAVHRATLSDRAPQPDDAVAAFRRVCADLGLAAEFEDFATGPLVAYTQGDVGPDNCIVAPGGLRLIDFELAAWRDPLLDTAHWRLGFPCCGCTGAIPEPLLAEMDAAHRRELGCAVPDGAPERARGLWLCNRITRLFAWGVLDEDWTWGRATGRQRVLALLHGFDGADHTPGLGDQVDRLEQHLRARWPDVPDTLPAYPALA